MPPDIKSVKQQDINEAFADITGALVGHFDICTVLERVVSFSMKVLHAEVCSIFLEDKQNEPGVLTMVAGSGFARNLVGKVKYRLGEPSFISAVVEQALKLNIRSKVELENLEVNGRRVWRGKSDAEQWPGSLNEFRNCIALPLKVKDNVIGIIKVENKQLEYGKQFTEYDEKYFEILANVVVLAIENARLHEQTERQLKIITANDDLWNIQERIVRSLYYLYYDFEGLRSGIQSVLNEIKTFFAVTYVALFLSVNRGESVLPLISEAGLSREGVDSVHFNWRKSGLPLVAGEPFNTVEWLNKEQLTPGFANRYIEMGVKGAGKNAFLPSIYLVPVASSQYRALLVIGDWLGPSIDTLPGRPRMMIFLRDIGVIFLTSVILKRALYESSQLEQKRDLILSLTAHSIRSHLHILYDALSRVERYSTRKESQDLLLGASNHMHDIILTMKRNTELMMRSPHKALIAQLHPSEMSIDNINISALLRNSIDKFTLIASSKNVAIQLSDDIDNIPIIKGDYHLLQIAFSNIIDNAIKYSESGKQVNIYTVPTTSPNDIIIAVADYGYGIPKEDLEKIFEPGYDSDKIQGRHRRHKGVGVGAYQARQIIRLHGGEIWVSSRPAHKDAAFSQHIVCFYIRLDKDKFR